jgi:hypothetical protein
MKIDDGELFKYSQKVYDATSNRCKLCNKVCWMTQNDTHLASSDHVRRATASYWLDILAGSTKTTRQLYTGLRTDFPTKSELTDFWGQDLAWLAETSIKRLRVTGGVFKYHSNAPAAHVPGACYRSVALHVVPYTSLQCKYTSETRAMIWPAVPDEIAGKKPESLTDEKTETIGDMMPIPTLKGHETWWPCVGVIFDPSAITSNPDVARLNEMACDGFQWLHCIYQMMQDVPAAWLCKVADQAAGSASTDGVWRDPSAAPSRG